jgi:hypothetical protein
MLLLVPVAVNQVEDGEVEDVSRDSKNGQDREDDGKVPEAGRAQVGGVQLTLNKVPEATHPVICRNLQVAAFHFKLGPQTSKLYLVVCVGPHVGHLLRRKHAFV